MEWPVVVLWIASSVLLGIWSDRKGHGLAAVLIVSLLLSPIVGLIVVLLQKPNLKEVEKSQLASGEMRKCPSCAEVIKAEAKVCRYCGRDVEQARVTEMASPAAQEAAPGKGPAVDAMLLGVLSVTLLSVLTGIPAIIVGARVLALRRPGRGMAIAGVAMGAVSVVLLLALIVVFSLRR